MMSGARVCRLRAVQVVCGFALLSGAVGCGGSKFEVAPVSGTCTCNGEALTAGMVVFEPVPKSGDKPRESGRAASGMIQSDGTYILSTYGNSDGAIIGEHTVRVFAPAPEDDDAPITDANRYACGNTPLQQVVEDGRNVINLELTYTPPPSRRR